ncbi:hypothetical protein EYC84_002940 [Monilinia fructicola]|uniref:glutamate decarboxylase n=1 Tax=Monilinia fructicola TaxID=38448 RepID=A0A5M9K077_MONFR|nr:hypothetical protein EYC84_002940 [Monilinia fructicola]
MTYLWMATPYLTSFVSTFMKKEAEDLMAESLSKNFIDYEEYPQSADIQNRCVSMIGRLFNAPTDQESDAAVGTSTVGSSEAIMLAVLAMKKRWQNSRRAAGKSTDKPNIVMSSAVQVCWEKAARYFEIEENYVYCTEDRYVLDPEEAVNLVDENTIGICLILGTTYTGEYEDVKAEDLWLHLSFQTWMATSMVSFIRVLDGSFWRAPEYLPKELVFNINYLGADQASFTLNFSKGASHIIAQYYQLIRLGKSGYRAIMSNLTRTADYLSDSLEQLGFVIMSQKHGQGLPLVAFRIDPKADKNTTMNSLWPRIFASAGGSCLLIPWHPRLKNLKMLRVVVREDFTKSRCDQLLNDIKLSRGVLEEMDKEAVQKTPGLCQNTLYSCWKEQA